MNHDFVLQNHLFDFDMIELNEMIKSNDNFKLFVRMFINRYMSIKFDDVEWNSYENQLLLLILSNYFFLF